MGGSGGIKGRGQRVFVYLVSDMPITNILVPSFENAMPVGLASSDETEVASTWAAVEASKAVDSVYSFISSPPYCLLRTS